MKIIDFFLENTWLLIVLLGFLPALFGRKKGQVESERRRNPRPVARPFQLPWEEDIEKDDKRNTTVEKRVQPPYSPNPVDKAKGALESLERTKIIQEKIVQEKMAQRGDDFKHSNSRLKTAKRNKFVDFSHIEPNQVVQGIIWSQVLGKPRAKEPYRSFGRLRR